MQQQHPIYPAPTSHTGMALCRAAVSPLKASEGKACSARNSLRHGLCAKTLVPGDDKDAEALAVLRGALVARHLPRDAAEAHWVEELAFAAWRQRRLRILEAEVLARAGAVGETEMAPALPSLSTLIRYHARLDRDWRRATEELEALRRDRAAPPSPAQLRLAADLIERGQAAADGATRKCANENEADMNEPGHADRTDESPPGTNEPGPPALDGRQAATAPLLLPLAASGMDEPAAAVPLNRHVRRRLAALRRRAA
jgi:hypothetical protein